MSRPSRPLPCLDRRGYLWLPQAWCTADHYVDIHLNLHTPAFRLDFTSNPSPQSFALQQRTDGAFLYVGGALRTLGVSGLVGEIPLTPSKQGWTWNMGGESGEVWIAFACRSSTVQNMASLDARGTLTLHRKTLESLGTSWQESASPQWNGQELHIEFHAQGELQVRRKGNVASLSLRGFLHSMGIPLPLQTQRMECIVNGNFVQMSWVKGANSPKCGLGGSVHP